MAGAAASYEQCEYWMDAARCHRAAGSPLRAAALHERIGRFDLAADDYAAAGDHERRLAARQPAPARRRPGCRCSRRGRPRRALVLAHCDLLEGLADPILPAVEQACTDLADPERVPFPHRDLETWAVAVSEMADRFDQVALVFAACVRGGRRGAADRWADWALRNLDTRLTIAEG